MSVCNSRASASNPPLPIYLLNSSDFYCETASCYVGTMSTFKCPLQWIGFLFSLSLQDRLWWSSRKEPCSFLPNSSQLANVPVKVRVQHYCTGYSGSTFINAKTVIALPYFHSICSPLKFARTSYFWHHPITGAQFKLTVTAPPETLSDCPQSCSATPGKQVLLAGGCPCSLAVVHMSFWGAYLLPWWPWYF